jgi:hypothetical protein
MVQLERGRENGFGEVVEQSALATAEKQYTMQTEVALKHFGNVIVEFDFTPTSVMQKSWEGSSLLSSKICMCSLIDGRPHGGTM